MASAAVENMALRRRIEALEAEMSEIKALIESLLHRKYVKMPKKPDPTRPRR